MDKSFWYGKKVLITGHTGFKGAWLSLLLTRLGANVTGFSLDSLGEKTVFEVSGVKANISDIRGDIRNIDSLRKVFKECRPEVVFHLAAQPFVLYSYDYPIETYETNVIGTLNVLEAIRETNTTVATVVVTSDKCYDNKEWEWGYRENDPMGGYDPYSSSKACVELLVSSYRNSYKQGNHSAIASVRAGNVIGGGDWGLNRLIPDIVNAFTVRAPVIVRHPNAIRPWQHVLEPLMGYSLLAQHMCLKGESFAEAWNFGPVASDAKSVKWIIEESASLWGKGASWSVDKDASLHEACYLRLDSSKANSKLDWYPRWDVQTALSKTIDWYSQQIKSADMRLVSEAQIDEYMSCF